MDPEATVRAYHDALRAGDPLGRFFAARDDVVKFGVGERLQGTAVAEGLREQTATTEDWRVESRRLVVGRLADLPGAGDGADRDAAWFSDDVFLAWSDVESGDEYAFDTRWSGTLVPPGLVGADGDAWRFVGMHVSVPEDA
jgi:hypothetical protein